MISFSILDNISKIIMFAKMNVNSVTEYGNNRYEFEVKTIGVKRVMKIAQNLYLCNKEWYESDFEYRVLTRMISKILSKPSSIRELYNYYNCIIDGHNDFIGYRHGCVRLDIYLEDIFFSRITYHKIENEILFKLSSIEIIETQHIFYFNNNGAFIDRERYIICANEYNRHLFLYDYPDITEPFIIVC